MPFPWTKSSVTRISQLVADLKSPKRAGSLVVHTGFPTSLIDLVVKNRRRFRKSKSKKPGRPDISPPVSPNGFTPLATGNVYGDDGVLRSGPEVCGSGSKTVLAEVPSVAGNVVGDDGVSVSGPESDGSGSKSVLALFLTMLAVVVLVVSVEKLAVAVTVSAFALLFLENAGKRVGVLNFLTRRIRVWVLFQRLQWKKKNGCECPEPANAEGDSIVVSECISESDEFLSFEEIEVVESKGEVSEDKKRVCSETLEDSIKGENFVGSCKGNRSVKFKSKMKKLLSKKLGSFRKEGKERKSAKESEVEATVKSHKSSLSFEGDGNISPLLLKIELDCVTENELDDADANTFSQECSLTVIGEGKRIEDGVGNSGYMILILIALFGLVAGRFAALALTMTWGLVLKIVATKGRWKVPLSKCSVPRS